MQWSEGKGYRCLRFFFSIGETGELLAGDEGLAGDRGVLEDGGSVADGGGDLSGSVELRGREKTSQQGFLRMV